MNKVVEKLDYSLKNNEFRDFLEGKGSYNIPSREGLFTDISTALYSGIYEYYELYPDSKIDKKFEGELIEMLHGENFDIMCAFDYCWRQITCEERKTAPFSLSQNCVLEVKKIINSKKDILSNYKDYVEFGSMLSNGAYEYSQNVSNMIESDYGRKIL